MNVGMLTYFDFVAWCNQAELVKLLSMPSTRPTRVMKLLSFWQLAEGVFCLNQRKFAPKCRQVREETILMNIVMTLTSVATSAQCL